MDSLHVVVRKITENHGSALYISYGLPGSAYILRSFPLEGESGVRALVEVKNRVKNENNIYL